MINVWTRHLVAAGSQMPPKEHPACCLDMRIVETIYNKKERLSYLLGQRRSKQEKANKELQHRRSNDRNIQGAKELTRANGDSEGGGAEATGASGPQHLLDQIARE